MLSFGITALTVLTLFLFIGKFLTSDPSFRLTGFFIVCYNIFLVTYSSLRYKNASFALAEALERRQIRRQLGVSEIKYTSGSQEQTSNSGTTVTNEEYFEKLVAINIENLSTYYIQVKAHANKGFMATLIVGFFGFTLLCAGLIYGMLVKDNNLTIAYLSFGSGVIIEFISAIYFRVYSKTVAQMKNYHDSLLYVQNILLSLKLIEGIDDKSKKTSTTTRIVEYLIKDNHQ